MEYAAAPNLIIRPRLQDKDRGGALQLASHWRWWWSLWLTVWAHCNCSPGPQTNKQEICQGQGHKGQN